MLLVFGGGILILFVLERTQLEPATRRPNYPAAYETPIGAPTNSIWWTGHEPATYQAICNVPQNREDADLCQQWRSAESAAKIVEISWMQLWATWFSVAGLAVTIFLTFRATHAAQRSARAAEISIDGADRPYFIVSKLAITPLSEPMEGDAIAYQYQYTNYGKGPGWIKAHYIWAHTAGKGEEATAKKIPAMSETDWPVVPNSWWGVADLSRTTAFHIPASEREDILSGKNNLYIFGILNYTNVSGTAYTYQFIQTYIVEQKRFVPVVHPFAKYT